MKKRFTTAMMMAAAITTVNAQVVLTYDGGDKDAITFAKGEKVDTVNWNWVEGTEAFDGRVQAGVKDGDRTVANIKIDGEVAANQAWMRVLKFDGLQIKPGTAYRVRLTQKGTSGTQVQVAMMRGDENCDMPWVAENADGNGKQEFRTNVNPTADYTTQTAMFYYGSDELQQKYYADYNKSIDMPDNQFLRLSFMNTGEYWLDNVVMEEANVAGVYYNGDAIRIDFGFPTNAQTLANASEDGAVELDPAMFTVTVNGEPAEVFAAEIKKDYGLCLFLNDAIDEGSEVLVSFNNSGIGMTYSGVLTPGDGKDVASFSAEKAEYDPDLNVASLVWEPAKLVSSAPADGSFELDYDTNTFTLTFNKEIIACDPAILSGQGINEELEPEIDGKTVTFKRAEGAAPLVKGSYSLVITDGTVLNVMGVGQEGDIRIDFEVGKVQVAGISYEDVEAVGMIGENGQQTENWTTYFGGDVREEGGETRCFTFAEGGLYTTGFYLCQRGAEVASELVYGAKEGYALNLPKGNVVITLLHSKWQGNGGNIGYELTDAEGNVLASGSAPAETSQADQGQVGAVTKTAIKLPDFAGAEGCQLRITSGEGWSGSIVFGFTVQTYTQTAGETADSEIKINEAFAAVGNGNRPAWGQGWNIYGDNGFLDKSGNGLSRIMNINTCEGLSCGYYNRFLGGTVENYCMTYGEPTRDDAPEGTEEPALELDGGVKYNFSWLACNWKGESNNYYFAIYDADTWDPETLTGEEIYKREDVITANVQGNEKNAVAQKIEFSFTPQATGNYILKWWMTGESVVGKIKIEKMGSLAVYWHNQLNDALAAAKDARAAYDDDRFAGTTRNAFDAEIAAAENPTYHTGAEYQAAIDRLAACTKAMLARRDALNEYDKVIGNISGLLAEVEGTKYATLEAYSTLKALYEQYGDVDPTTMEDEVLLPTQKGLTNGYDYLNNMKNSVINLYTKQLVTLATEICTLDDEYEWNNAVIATGNALTDDQALANDLQKLYTYVIYSKVATGDDIFQAYDEEYDTYEEAPIEATGYIRNADVYATPLNSLDWAFRCSDAATVFPGWTIVGDGSVNYGWGWGEEKATDNKPSVNAGFKSPWASGDIDVSQTVVNLPVGTYKYVASTGDGAVDDNNEVGSKMYYELGEDVREEVSFVFNGEKGNRGTGDCAMEGIEVAAGENNMGSLTIGAVLSGRGGDGSATDFSQIDNFRLYMTGKNEAFDYAAAAAAVKGLLTAVKDVKADRTDAPASVLYYDLSGRQTNAPKGICVKVERWSDGFLRVSKELKK